MSMVPEPLELPSDFLLHMEILASRDPCLVPKPDMLRLVEMAGFERTHLAYHQVEAAGDPVLVLRSGVLQLIAMTRELPIQGKRAGK